MNYSIGLIGAGVMGFAIGSRLLETGNQLRVFDRNSHKVDQLTAKGAIGCATSSETAIDAEFIITSLNSAESVDDVIFGTAGVAEAANSNALIIDMSSIDPGSTRLLAQKAKEIGLRWVDSPLSGGAPKALIGELTLMVGGETKDVDDASNVLQFLASNFTHMGENGGRQTDASPTSLEMLPHIRQAIGDRAAILLDSGVRSGLDVARALACGADFVLLGRAFYYGLAAIGQHGAKHVVNILAEELQQSLRQIGCSDVDKLDETWLTITKSSNTQQEWVIQSIR